jgi:hypothetical protein
VIELYIHPDENCCFTVFIPTLITTVLRSYKVIRNSNIVINSTIIGASAAETNQINYYGGQAVKFKVWLMSCRVFWSNKIVREDVYCERCSLLKSANLTPSINSVTEVKVLFMRI